MQNPHGNLDPPSQRDPSLTRHRGAEMVGDSKIRVAFLRKPKLQFSLPTAPESHPPSRHENACGRLKEKKEGQKGREYRWEKNGIREAMTWSGSGDDDDAKREITDRERKKEKSTLLRFLSRVFTRFASLYLFSRGKISRQPGDKPSKRARAFVGAWICAREKPTKGSCEQVSAGRLVACDTRMWI